MPLSTLVCKVRLTIPTEDQVMKIALDVESEMLGMTLNTENAFTFTEEVKRRVGEMLVVEITES